MSLESILSRIINTAKSEREEIIRKAKNEAKRIIQEAKEEAERVYELGLEREKTLLESQGQRIIVSARLEGKKILLGAKQELIDLVFERLKSQLTNKGKFRKQQVLQDETQEVAAESDFYLAKIRPDYETEIAKILFGQ